MIDDENKGNDFNYSLFSSDMKKAVNDMIKTMNQIKEISNPTKEFYREIVKALASSYTMRSEILNGIRDALAAYNNEVLRPTIEMIQEIKNQVASMNHVKELDDVIINKTSFLLEELPDVDNDEIALGIQEAISTLKDNTEFFYSRMIPIIMLIISIIALLKAFAPDDADKIEKQLTEISYYVQERADIETKQLEIEQEQLDMLKEVNDIIDDDSEQ